MGYVVIMEYVVIDGSSKLIFVIFMKESRLRICNYASVRPQICQSAYNINPTDVKQV